MMVQTPRARLHVVDHPGNHGAFVLMHGFPDDSRIYDGLIPLLGPRRVVAFDSLGYGRSRRPHKRVPRIRRCTRSAALRYQSQGGERI
jgi:haloalkane dehalogenase